MKADLTHNWRACLPFVVLMAAAYLLYLPAFSAIWLMDDLPVLVNNPDIRSFSNFLEDYYPGRPLRELTYLVDYYWFGLEPAGYYLQHIFWHGLCAWLVFVLARRLQAPVAVAWCAALLFLAHPVQVEVVANISHRKDSLALAFCLLALLAYARGRAALAPSRWGWLTAALLLWGVALTAKQNALVLPLVVAACELYKLPPAYRRPLWLASVTSACFGILGWLVYLLNSVAFKAEIGPALRKLGHFAGGSAEQYFLTVFKAWAHMGSKLVYPVELSMEYTFPVPTQWTDPWVVAGLAGGIAAVAGTFWALRRAALVYLGLIWLLAFWLPTSNLLGHLAYFAADRYWYSPLAGVALLAAYGLWRLLRGNRAAYAVLAGLLLASLGWLSWQQQQLWGDEERFYQHMHRVNPDALEGLVGLGHIAMRQGDYDRAVDYFQKAFQRSPQDGRIPHNLGYIAYKQGYHEAALSYFQRALALKPDLVDVHNNLGSLYDDLGQPDKAIAILEQALVINPHFEKAYTNLGVVYERQGQLQKSAEMHRRALRERPDYGEAHYNLGNTLYRAGRKQEALASYRLATRFSPAHADALYNYAVVASELGQPEVVANLLARLKALDARLADELARQLD